MKRKVRSTTICMTMAFLHYTGADVYHCSMDVVGKEWSVSDMEVLMVLHMDTSGVRAGAYRAWQSVDYYLQQ